MHESSSPRSLPAVIPPHSTPVGEGNVRERTASPVGQQRGLAILLRLLILLLAQQAFPLLGGAAATTATAMLKATTAVVGFLLTPQAAQAQATLTATAGDEQVTLSWTYTGGSSVPTNPKTKFAYQQKEGDSGNYSTWMVISGSDKDTREYAVTNLTNGTKYYFKVADGRSFGGSFIPSGAGASNEATATPVVPTAGVMVSKARLTIPEGSEDTYTVKRNAAPSANVAVTPGSDNTDVTVPPPSLTSSLSLPDSAAATTATAMLKATAAVVGFLLTPQAAQAQATLTATAGDEQVTLSWTYTGGSSAPTNPNAKFAYQQKEGDSGNYSAWMVISGSDKDTREHEVTDLTNGTKYYFKVADGRLLGSSFIPSGAGVSNEATATPMAPTPTPVVPTTAGVTVSKARLTILEGSEGSYTVKLNTAPPANVVVTPSSNNTNVTFTPPSLTFTTTTYSKAQTVRVSADADEDVTDDTATMSHSVDGSGDYSSVTASSVTVTVTDTTPTLELDSAFSRISNKIEGQPLEARN